MTSTAEAEGPEERIEIDRVQRGVAAVVTLSHREIPAASLVMKVPVDGALGRARLLMTETRQIVGLPELLIGAIAAAREPFPLAFAERIDDRTARVRPGAHVAVTVDLGNGLYLPVLRDAQAATTQQIAEWLAGARQQASKAAFRAEELTGANIMLSLHTEPDVVFATPLIFPGHACVVSLGGVQEEARAVRGEILSARFVHLGLAYDHRIINGRLAIAFCRRLKETLEKPG
jgi:2-oxoglutarate dehydrogenase E2 component (dihydrolipoamide succinyltransferase)